MIHKSYGRIKKLSNQRPISLWIPDYSVDALCISFSTLYRKNTAPDSTIVHSVQESHLLTDYSFYVLYCSLTVAYYRHICPSALSVKNYTEYGTFCQLTIWTILFLCYPFSDNVHFHTYDLCYFFYLHSFFQKSLSDIMCFLHFAFFPAFYSSFFQTCSHGTLLVHLRAFSGLALHANLFVF